MHGERTVRWKDRGHALRPQKKPADGALVLLELLGLLAPDLGELRVLLADARGLREVPLAQQPELAPSAATQFNEA